LSGCAKEPQNRVVLYCSVDDVYAKPIVADLEKRTGLQIDALYDVESAKTAGLANRIRAEKARPRADVFWSSALLQTLLLQREGLLQEYSSPNAKDIPAAYKDPHGAWTGMGTRARVIMFRDATKRTQLTADDLLNPQWKNRIGISSPQFGTASDSAAVLAIRWGKARTLEYFRALKKNGVHVWPGNGMVADNVVHGDLWAGVVDSDDFYAAIRDLEPSQTKFRLSPFVTSPDRAVLIPGSVAMLKGAPHDANARKLVDAILDPQTELQLAKTMRGVLPLHKTKLKMPADAAQWARAWDEIREPLAQILLTD
jgi:iron(III) transport system substrate-binding protein